MFGKFHLFLVVGCTFVFFSLNGCNDSTEVSSGKNLAPYGVFTLERREEYKIVIEKDNVYQLCKSAYCTSGQYIHDQENKNFIKLLDFYKMDLGLDLEKIAVENGYIDGNYEMAVEYRLSEPSPNDLVFSVSDHCSSPCFVLGLNYSEGALFLRDNDTDDSGHKVGK